MKAPVQTTGGSSFLRWAGSKRKLLPKLRAYWRPSFNRYIEPFMGSACFFFDLQPPVGLLSDVNDELVRTFRAVRDAPTAVYQSLNELPLGKKSYLKIREQEPCTLSSISRAARFIYLNRFCFNGLYRTNNLGKFNVPYSGVRTGSLPSLRGLQHTSKLLCSAEITTCDFESTLGKTLKGDFIYLDPPYAVGNRRIFRQYGPDSFGLDDLERLQAQLVALDRRGASFLVSYAFCPEAKRMFRGWETRKTFTQRNIAGFGHTRRKAAELLISNFLPGDEGGR